MSTETMPEGVDPLTRLAIKHGTDKWGLHFYTPIYHDLFCRLRDQPIRLLEIGVGGYELKTVGGASLAMWADYFANGQITGIDVAQKQLSLDPRIKVFQGSQVDPGFLKAVCDQRGPFDIIIDDGSHVPKHVVASFQILFPALADGGLYVIEDVQTAFWPDFGGSMLHGGDTVKLARTAIECINHAELAVVKASRTLPNFARQVKAFRAFHNIFVVEKGENSEPSNLAYDLTNPHAAKAVKSIEEELSKAPTPEGMANLIDVYLSGRDPAGAKEISDKALSLWPENPALLLGAYRVAKATNDLEAQIASLERVLRIEPDNLAMRERLKEARAQSIGNPQDMGGQRA